MNTSVILTAIVTFTLGGAVGGGVVHLVTTTQATCPVQSVAKPPSTDGMAQLLKPTPMPLTGYRNY